MPTTLRKPDAIARDEIDTILWDVEMAVLGLEILGKWNAIARRKAKILRDALNTARAED